MERADRVGVNVFNGNMVALVHSDGNMVALVQIVERIDGDERQNERHSAG
jgi:hypothetical protein